MKAIVTGGCGFIGSHIVDLLVHEGMDVCVIDNMSTGRKENFNPKAQLIEKGVLDIDGSILSDCEYVFHMAALPRIQPSFDEPLEHEMANVMATIHLMMQLKGSKKLRKIVYSSSSSVYGTPEVLPTNEDTPVHPLSPYALQKYAAEQYVLLLGNRFGIPAVVLRYFNVYGPRSFNPIDKLNAYSSVVGIFAEQFKKGQPLTITGDGMQMRDFVHVKDVARANWLAALSPIDGEIYNVGSGEHIAIADLAKMFSPNCTFVPERQGEGKTTWSDISKIKRDLKWEPTIHLKQGIKELCAELI